MYLTCSRTGQLGRVDHGLMGLLQVKVLVDLVTLALVGPALDLLALASELVHTEATDSSLNKILAATALVISVETVAAEDVGIIPMMVQEENGGDTKQIKWKNQKIACFQLLIMYMNLMLYKS